MKGLKRVKLFVYMTVYLAVVVKSTLQGSQLFGFQLQIKTKYTGED